MQQQLNVSLEQTTAIKCDECGGLNFNQAFHIRKASGLLTGSTKPSYIPIPVFACIDCGHVNKEFLPKQVTDLEGN